MLQKVFKGRRRVTPEIEDEIAELWSGKTVLDDVPHLRRVIADFADNPPEGYGDMEMVSFMKSPRGNQAWKVVEGAEFQKIEGRVLARGLSDRRFVQGNIDGTSGTTRAVHGSGQ